MLRAEVPKGLDKADDHDVLPIRQSYQVTLAMTMLGNLKAANAERWVRMQVTPSLAGHIDGVASRLIAAKARYQGVARATHVPWFIIAVIHEREASQSWQANLAQGDPWCDVSVHVPCGRGPFCSWEDAAIDALKNCSPHAARWLDWSAGGALTLLEQYNGLGYANRNMPSPYIWASTDQYESGKYIADGHFDPDAIDHQLGCASLISRMMTKDSSVSFIQSTAQRPAALPQAEDRPPALVPTRNDTAV